MLPAPATTIREVTSIIPRDLAASKWADMAKAATERRIYADPLCMTRERRKLRLRLSTIVRVMGKTGAAILGALRDLSSSHHGYWRPNALRNSILARSSTRF